MGVIPVQGQTFRLKRGRYIKTRKHEGFRAGLQVGWVYPYSRWKKRSKDYHLSPLPSHTLRKIPLIWSKFKKKRHKSNSSLCYFPHVPTVKKRAPTITSHFCHLITKKSPSTVDMTQPADGALGIAHDVSHMFKMVSFLA